MSDPNDPTQGGAVPPPPGQGFPPPPPPPSQGFPPPPAPDQGGYPPPPPAAPSYTPPPPPPAAPGYTPPAAPGYPPQPQPGPAGYMPPPPGAPPPGYQAYQPGGMNPAGNLAEPGMRVLARIIDWVVMFVVTLVIAIPAGIGMMGAGGDAGAGLAIGLGLVIAAIGIAYEVLLTANRGQTLGKMAVGIKIVRVDGQPMDLQSAATRYSPSIAIAVLGVFPLIGILAGLAGLVLAIANLVMVFSSKESVYDKVGKTEVISVK